MATGDNFMYEPHEFASFLPAMRSTDYERLKEDIAKNGLLEPIVLYEEQILDGIHRDRACNELGIDADYEDYEGDDPARYVFSKNLSRRHLTTSQLSMIGTQLEEHFALEAKKRQGSRTDLRRNIQAGRPRSSSAHQARQARDDAAKVVGVSGRSISRAKRVKLMRPDLVEKIKSGELAVNAADEEIRTGKRKGNAPEPEPKPAGRVKNFNGKSNAKRMGEIKQERKRTGKYTDLLKLQLEMTRLCVVLEDYEPDDFGLDTTTADLIVDFHEDLISLGMWWQRSMQSTTAWLSDIEFDDRLAKLRVRTVENGFEEVEEENALAMIAKLERAREALLEAGDQV